MFQQIVAVLLVIAGVALGGVGAISIFAGGMSDEISDGDNASSVGCLLLIVGVVAFIAGVLLYHFT